jgi:hypothetical protein
MSWIQRVKPSFTFLNPYVILTGKFFIVMFVHYQHVAYLTARVVSQRSMLGSSSSYLVFICVVSFNLLSHVVRRIATIPSLDGTVQNGKGHLDSKIGLIKVCEMLPFPPCSNSLQQHCQSADHFHYVRASIGAR